LLCQQCAQRIDKLTVVFGQSGGDAHMAWTERRVVQRLDQDVATAELVRDPGRTMDTPALEHDLAGAGAVTPAAHDRKGEAGFVRGLPPAGR